MDGILQKRAERAGLAEVRAKTRAGERLTAAEALRLLECADVALVGALADEVRSARVGDRVTFIQNLYVNYSNVCILSCQFCAFGKKKRDPEAWELSIPEIVEKARAALRAGITEIHIVGGLHPTLPFDFYLDMLRSLKALDGRLFLKAFTAVEIYHLAWRAKSTVPETLRALKEAGLDGLTGGGAEIFNPAVREKICRGKETAEEWLDCHRQAHRIGLPTTCTMLYGHVESLADRVDHLSRLRELQDETGGFVGFVPLSFHPENTELASVPKTSSCDDLKTIAVARLFLDNFQNITAYWIGLGTRPAQIALSYGANDLHGTLQEEHIFHMAGSRAPTQTGREELVRMIREAGRVPVQRDSLYQPIERPEERREPEAVLV
ncbi:MAG: aminofutalosine synthase MqnE [Verrucomicrobiae bacterium]|nr:aminofutalosine synthase MqnE [Verrucomicrobiae bacterium]